MINQVLSKINLILCVFSVLIFSIAFYFYLTQPNEIEISSSVATKRKPPTHSFQQPITAYESIGSNSLQLKNNPLEMQLPDLRTLLSFSGKNNRPDAIKDNLVMHVSFTGNVNSTSVFPNKKYFIFYDRSKSPSQYIFSPSNEETPLWLEFFLQGNELIVKVFMKTEKGLIIHEPAVAQFKLLEKDGGRVAGRVWEMGKWRVDGSLLARQKAKWIGKDLFLEHHGGEEFSNLTNKQRIEFTDEDQTYSVFVGLNDTLKWNNNRWQEVKKEEITVDFPLLVVKKIEERLINLELWDISGRNKVVLNLIKTHENIQKQDWEKIFQFVGARTHSQYIFEIEGNRLTINPKDWLLKTAEGWIKLISPKQIDDFVNRKISGILFIFDGVIKKEGKQVLKTIIFNPSRSDVQEMHLTIQQGNCIPSIANAKIKNKRAEYSEDEDEDDEDDEDDDDDDDEEEEEEEEDSIIHKKLKTSVRK